MAEKTKKVCSPKKLILPLGILNLIFIAYLLIGLKLKDMGKLKEYDEYFRNLWLIVGCFLVVNIISISACIKNKKSNQK